MSRDESAQIGLARAFCIISMMWIHVNPGISFPSFATGGPLDGLGSPVGKFAVGTD